QGRVIFSTCNACRANLNRDRGIPVFLATIFVDTVPCGYVDNTVAAAKYFRQLRPVENRSFDKHRFRFQIRGARTSRMTGVSPLSSNLGTRVWPRSPDPPVISTFMVFSATC